MRTTETPFTAATDTYAYAQAFTAPLSRRPAHEHRVLARLRRRPAGAAR